MGGGKSSSSNEYYTYDNDVAAQDSAIAFGGQDNTNTYISDNEGTIISVGDGSSYINQSLDENSRSLIDNAMHLMHDNAESAFEIAANLSGATEKEPEFMNATTNGQTADQKTELQKIEIENKQESVKWLACGVAVAASAFVIMKVAKK